MVSNRNNREMLTKCAADYAFAIGSPFHPRAVGACVPTFPARISQKVTSKITLQVIVGSANFGYILVSPALANDVKGYYYTGAYYTGTTVTSTGTGISSGSFNNLPYAAASFVDGTSSANSSVSGRIVSCGIRARYVGTTLNQSGTVYGLVSPDHGNLNGVNLQQVTAYRETFSRPCSRSWSDLTISAIEQSECEYPDASTYVALGNTNLEYLTMMYPFSQQTAIEGTTLDSGAAPMIMLFTGYAGNAYEVELILHAEYVGRVCNPAATRSHSDQAGLSKIIDAAGAAPLLRASNYTSTASAIAQSIGSTLWNNREHLVTAANLIGGLMSSSTPSLRGVRTITNEF